MKNLFFISILLSFNAFSINLSGCWKSESSSATYDLTIHEMNHKLSGSYCFINANGNRIDCDKDSSLINGSVSNGIGVISFGGGGKGQLSYDNNHLTLKIIDPKPFEDFNMHLPTEIILSKSDKCKK